MKSKALTRLLKLSQEPGYLRSCRSGTSHLYIWMRNNYLLIKDIREKKQATWEEIVEAASKEGVELQSVKKSSDSARKYWSRIQNEKKGLPVDLRKSVRNK